MKKIIFFFILILFAKTNFAQNPYSYDLKYQRLEFQVEPTEKYIVGKITSYFEVKEDNFQQIAFDLFSELVVDSVIFQQELQNYNHSGDTLLIYLNSEIEKNNLDSISVFYQGVPNESGFRSFVVDNHNDVPIMWTLSEPYGAKDWWACKQQLNDKIDSIDMFVTTPLEYKVAGNGILISEKISENKKITHWKQKYPVETYLLAFATTNYVEYSDFVQVNDTLNIEILNYVYPESLQYAQENTPNIIDVFQFFCDTFMIYPFHEEKYGHAQFNRNGGMEHQTMSFMGKFTHHLMAHELAHQWFGNYITCGSWQDIWLNEGFATYLEGLTAEQGLAEYDWLTWKADKISEITNEPDGSVFCYDTSSVARIFSQRLSYSKGAMVLHMLRKQVGDHLFFESIRKYLHDPKLAYGYAKTNDLKRHFEQTCQQNLTEFFNDWVYGEGYPVYQIFYSQDTDNTLQLTVNQSQTHSSVSFFEMKLPLTIFGENCDTTVILENNYQAQKFEVPLDFYVTHITFDTQNDIIQRGSTVNKIYPNGKNYEIIAYPNPTQNFATVKFPEKIFVEKYSIFNSEGKLIRNIEQNKPQQFLEINFSDFHSGIYTILIITPNKNFEIKIEKL